MLQHIENSGERFHQPHLYHGGGMTFLVRPSASAVSLDLTKAFDTVSHAIIETLRYEDGKI